MFLQGNLKKTIKKKERQAQQRYEDLRSSN